MSEQTAACMCGHPRSDHPDPASQTDIPPQYRGGCNGDGDCCGCEIFRPRPPITWPAIAAVLESIRDQTDRCLRDAADRLEVGHTPEEGVMQAHRVRGLGLRMAQGRVHALLAHVAESMPPALPARSLEAVLADIVAEGYTAQFSVHHDRCYLSTWIDGRDATTPAANWIHGDGENVVALAETRLAQIRELHREKLERDGLAADVPDAVKQRALDSVAVHFGHVAEPACGAEPSGRISLRPEDVTCPACRAWLDVNAIARADHQREAEASEDRTPDEVCDLHDAGDDEEGA